MGLPGSIEPERIRRHSHVRHYFRYRLHRRDFQPIRTPDGRLLGYAAAKPLYGQLDERGRVDRSSGFDGRIAVLFIPSPARSARGARVLFTRLPIHSLITGRGTPNRKAIREAASRIVRARV